MLDRDSSDRLHEPHKSFWAIWIILFVCIIFGWFWYIEQAKQSQVSVPTPITTPTASLDTLQAAVIDSDIPDFSSQF